MAGLHSHSAHGRTDCHGADSALMWLMSAVRIPGGLASVTRQGSVPAPGDARLGRRRDRALWRLGAGPSSRNSAEVDLGQVNTVHSGDLCGNPAGRRITLDGVYFCADREECRVTVH